MLSDENNLTIETRTQLIVSETMNMLEHEYGIEDLVSLGAPTVTEIAEHIDAMNPERGLHIVIESDDPELLQQLSIWMSEAVNVMAASFNSGYATVVTNKVRNKVTAS